MFTFSNYLNFFILSNFLFIVTNPFFATFLGEQKQTYFFGQKQTLLSEQNQTFFLGDSI